MNQVEIIEFKKGLFETKAKVKIGGCSGEIRRNPFSIEIKYTPSCTEEEKENIREFAEHDKLKPKIVEITENTIEVVRNVKTAVGIGMIGIGILTQNPATFYKGLELL